MISLATPSQATIAPAPARTTLAGLFRDMLRAWLAHHQRMADLGLAGQP